MGVWTRRYYYIEHHLKENLLFTEMLNIAALLCSKLLKINLIFILVEALKPKLSNK